MPAVFVFIHLAQQPAYVTESFPVITRITIYPFKSFDGTTVSRSGFSPAGTLKLDRAYALFDHASNQINGKSEPAIHRLSVHFDDSIQTVTFCRRDTEEPMATFRIEQERSGLEEYLSQYFGKRVILKGDTASGFPDDPEQSQLTVVSTASLKAVSEHFGFTIDECRKRFRANIEVGNVPAFWEEQLVLPRKQPVGFRIGDARFVGVKPCPRCVVPSRHPDTGEVLTGFQKKMAALRKETLPEWSPLPSYGNYYQLSVSCRSDLLHNRTASVAVGDPLFIDGLGNDNKKPAVAG